MIRKVVVFIISLLDASTFVLSEQNDLNRNFTLLPAKLDVNTGVVEIVVNEVYLPICSHEWDTSYNNDLCSILGYG